MGECDNESGELGKWQHILLTVVTYMSHQGQAAAAAVHYTLLGRNMLQ
jgi:hypothetical protein